MLSSANVLDKFSENVKKFSQMIAKPTANAIYKFIKEIGINITIPPSNFTII